MIRSIRLLLVLLLLCAAITFVAAQNTDQTTELDNPSVKLPSTKIRTLIKPISKQSPLKKKIPVESEPESTDLTQSTDEDDKTSINPDNKQLDLTRGRKKQPVQPTIKQSESQASEESKDHNESPSTERLNYDEAPLKQPDPVSNSPVITKRKGQRTVEIEDTDSNENEPKTVDEQDKSKSNDKQSNQADDQNDIADDESSSPRKSRSDTKQKHSGPSADAENESVKDDESKAVESSLSEQADDDNTSKKLHTEANTRRAESEKVNVDKTPVWKLKPDVPKAVPFNPPTTDEDNADDAKDPSADPPMQPNDPRRTEVRRQNEAKQSANSDAANEDEETSSPKRKASKIPSQEEYNNPPTKSNRPAKSARDNQASLKRDTTIEDDKQNDEVLTDAASDSSKKSSISENEPATVNTKQSDDAEKPGSNSQSRSPESADPLLVEPVTKTDSDKFDEDSQKIKKDEVDQKTESKTSTDPADSLEKDDNNSKTSPDSQFGEGIITPQPDGAGDIHPGTDDKTATDSAPSDSNPNNEKQSAVDDTKPVDVNNDLHAGGEGKSDTKSDTNTESNSDLSSPSTSSSEDGAAETVNTEQPAPSQATTPDQNSQPASLETDNNANQNDEPSAASPAPDKSSELPVESVDPDAQAPVSDASEIIQDDPIAASDSNPAKTTRDAPFSIMGWLLSHFLFTVILLASCIGSLVYYVHFRASHGSNAGFMPVSSHDDDIERGGNETSMGKAESSMPSFSSLTGSKSGDGYGEIEDIANSPSGPPSEEQYKLALLKYSDSSAQGAQALVEAVLSKLGIPSYGQATFTSKLKDNYLNQISQLQELDTADWKRLAFPLVIEEAIRQALDDRKHVMSGEDIGDPKPKAKGGLSLKAPTKPPSKAATSPAAKKVKPSVVATQLSSEAEDEEDGWGEMEDF